MGRKRRTSRGTPRAHARGIIEVNRAGFGFVRTAEGDFFIPRSCTGEAFDGDLVEVARRSGGRRGRVPSGEQRPEARVVRVVERAHTTLVGTFEVAEPFGIVVPDDARIQHDIFTDLAAAPDIPDGSLVRVCIDAYPTRKSSAFGHVIEVLGGADDALLSSERIIARNDIRTAFSEEALAQADACAVDGADALAEGYRDIRERFTFTIDPADAKDFDDALSVERIGAYEGRPCRWRLGVHIADVAHYVPWGSAIDEEARKRATSVYLADRVVPMLPPRLSDDVCSLRPGAERRCMTVDLYVDANGGMVGCDMYPALMRSDARLTYAQAKGILDGSETVDDALGVRLRDASAIASLREGLRAARGALEFSTKEAKVRLDDEGRAVGISIRSKDAATALVEEAMIFANEAVASWLEERALPCAFRVHEAPHVDALEGVVAVLREFKWMSAGLAERLLRGEAAAIQQTLAEVRGRVEEGLVTTLLLRAMTRAAYAPVNTGHYGLGSAAYCHFTSPIRRYPDLLVHRFLKAALAGRAPARAMADRLPRLCEHSSAAERAADASERLSQEMKMAEYLQGFVGERFDAVISGVATYGIYVQLDCTAEGLVPIRDLGREYFIFDAAGHLLRGSDTGRIFRLGQPIEVVLTQVDVLAPALTFRPAPRMRA